VVQPQVGLTEVISRVSGPTLRNLKAWTTVEPLGIDPKSHISDSNFNLALDAGLILISGCCKVV
jgi:hypothetical protein